MSRSYALGERLEAFIDEQVKSGRYGDASEVVRAALRLLESEEEVRRIGTDELRPAVDEGRASGLSDEDGEAFLDRLEARYRATADRTPM